MVAVLVGVKQQECGRGQQQRVDILPEDSVSFEECTILTQEGRHNTALG